MFPDGILEFGNETRLANPLFHLLLTISKVVIFVVYTELSRAELYILLHKLSSYLLSCKVQHEEDNKFSSLEMEKTIWSSRRRRQLIKFI